MARVLKATALGGDVTKRLARSFQSGHVNFLIGSGASYPAIPAAGNVEKEIAALLDAGQQVEARAKMYNFMLTVQGPMNNLIEGIADAVVEGTLNHYKTFLRTIETILLERRTTLLPRQATIFTTNYDLFLEKASGDCPGLIFNDGFSRSPTIDRRLIFTSRNFFQTTYNTGNLYEYKVEVPSVNLVKLHGSLSWKADGEDILFDVAQIPPLVPPLTDAAITAFVDKYAVVLPESDKFRLTLMKRTYYDLLRIYANALDRENTLLIAFGFSFGDEHIRDISNRALKNPTLRLVIFAFNESATQSFQTLFEAYNNVEIIAPEAGAMIGFAEFNQLLQAILHGSTPP